MRTFKDLCNGKVWVALQAMVDGLKEQSQRENCLVDLDVLGEVRNGSLVGDTGICTIQKLTGIDITIDTISSQSKTAKQLNVDKYDLDCFDRAVDDARRGSVKNLFSYMHKSKFYDSAYNDLFHLNTSTWQTELPKVEQLIKKLKAKDI